MPAEPIPGSTSNRRQQDSRCRSRLVVLSSILACGLLFASTLALQRPRRGDAASPDAERRARSTALSAFGHLPLAFEENRGQTAPEVRFLARALAFTVFLTGTEAVLSLNRPSPPTSEAPLRPEVRNRPRSLQSAPSVLRLRCVGANTHPQVAPVRPLPGRSNYLHGQDPSRWITGVAQCAGVRYRQVYPGIDLVYYGNQNQLEHDFVVGPGADPSRIRFAWEGAERLELDSDGNLVLQTSGGTVRQQRPTVYQEIGARRIPVRSRYTLASGASTSVSPSDGLPAGNSERTATTTTVGFELGAYDRNRPLIIDPVLIYSTYLGGSDTDVCLDVTVSKTGNAYVTGATRSADFPTHAPVSGNLPDADAFVAKLSQGGNALVYSTYLGGSGVDQGLGIAVDPKGRACVTGVTDSTDFPTLREFQPDQLGLDCFVAKLAPGGNQLIYSTYLGGNGADAGNAIAVDKTGRAYVTGSTESTDFPLARSFQGDQPGKDAFVTKLFPNGGPTVVYSTYLGGEGIDMGNGIAADASGRAYVSGSTGSTDFPMVRAFQGNATGTDAFVTKLFSNGGSTLIYSTYLGGSAEDFGARIAADTKGRAYVTGVTESSDFPTVREFQRDRPGPDAFVTKLASSGGASLIYSTYLGGSDIDQGSGIAADAKGRAYVTGATLSTDFPLRSPMQQDGIGADAFVTKIAASGGHALIYSTYLGGNGVDQGIAIAVDSKERATIAGFTLSTNFPLKSPFQHDLPGADAFVTRISR